MPAVEGTLASTSGLALWGNPPLSLLLQGPTSVGPFKYVVSKTRNGHRRPAAGVLDSKGPPRPTLQSDAGGSSGQIPEGEILSVESIRRLPGEGAKSPDQPAGRGDASAGGRATVA